MVPTRPVPRLLQRPTPIHPPSSPSPSAHVPGERRQKGDLRTQVEAPQPSRDREAGDLESTERETHGQA